MEDSNNTNSNKNEILCRVCGDKASGKHYGVSSCDGCRGFFKRSIRRNLEYVCKENGGCIVDVTRRNQCQACRFRKCLQVNMKKDAVQHERAPRSSSLHHFGGPLGSRLRTVHSASLFAGLPLHLPGPPLVDPASVSTPSPYLHHSFLYPSMLAGFVKPTVLTAGLMSNPSAFSQKPDTIQIGPHRSNISSMKDDEVTSSEETTFQERKTTQDDLRDNKKSPLNETKIGYDISTEPFRQTIRPVDLSSLTILPTENIYESAAKLLFLSVKWARTIPSFLQLSYRDQSILLEESWSELFVLTAAQWTLPIDENTLVSNAITATSRSHALEENARRLRDIITRLTVLRVDHTEYACLKALVLFKADCRGICDPAHVEMLQDQTHVMLHEYCQNRPCTPKGRFGKLLLVLPAVQGVSRRGLEELLFRKTVGDVAIERLLGDMVKAASS